LHNTINAKCWQSKGGQNTIMLPSNTGRKRITILGAINPINLCFTSITLEGMVDKIVTKIVLDNIRETYNDGKPIVIIMDNAAYNRAYEVQAYAVELGIVIKYLPPYSPNLNLIERVWKFLKRKLKNKYIEKFHDFKIWIDDFCKNFESYHDEIKKIISNKLQIIKEA
jgi:transposase